MQGKLLSCEFYHSIYTVLLSFFGVVNTHFPFRWILFRKFLPSGLVVLREFSFFRRTVLIPLPSKELNLSLSILAHKESSVTPITKMSLNTEFSSSPNSQSLEKFYNYVINSSKLWPSFCK